MSNAELYIVMGCFMVILIGTIGYFAQHDMRVRGDAERIIKEAGTKAGASLRTENVTYRKPRRVGFLFFVLFLVLFLASIYDINFNLDSLNRYGHPITLFGAIIGILISMVPLVIAVNQWLYSVSISDDGIVISAFRTRRVLFEEIREIRIGAVKAASFCQILLKTGKHLTVGSELGGFLDFVKRMSEKVSKSKDSP